MRTSNDSYPPASSPVQNKDASYGSVQYQSVLEKLNDGKKTVKHANVYLIVSAIGIVAAVLFVVMALVTVGSSMM